MPLSRHRSMIKPVALTLLVTTQQQNWKLRQNRLLFPQCSGSQVLYILMLLTQLLAYTFVIMLNTVIYAIYFIIIMTDRLFLYHLRQVLGLVWDARTQYYNIGLALDLPPGDIDAIVSGNSHIMPNPIFTEMINECLRRGLVTQEKLAKAVSSPQVCFAYLSDCILAEKFTTAPQTPRCEFSFVIS